MSNNACVPNYSELSEIPGSVATAYPMTNYDPTRPVATAYPMTNYNPTKPVVTSLPSNALKTKLITDKERMKKRDKKRNQAVKDKIKGHALGTIAESAVSAIPFIGPALVTGYQEMDKAGDEIIQRETAEGYYNAIRNAFTKIDQRLNLMERNIDHLYELNGEKNVLLPDLSLSGEFSGEVERDAVLAKGKLDGGKYKRKNYSKKKRCSKKKNKRNDRKKLSNRKKQSNREKTK